MKRTKFFKNNNATSWSTFNKPTAFLNDTKNENVFNSVKNELSKPTNYKPKIDQACAHQLYIIEFGASGSSGYTKVLGYAINSQRDKIESHGFKINRIAQINS